MAAPASAAGPVSPSTAQLQISARDGNTLVLAANGLVYGAGENEYGQLTGSDAEDVRTLRRLAGMPATVGARSIAMGYEHAVVVGSNGVAYGTGENGSGQVTGEAETKTLLTAMTGLPRGVKALVASASWSHTVVLGSNGLVYGTGRNVYGQLTGADNADIKTLTVLTGLPAGVKASAISAGDYHVLVVGSNGVAYGAGGNRNGQLTGVGVDEKRTLSPLSGLPSGVRATAVAGGFDHSLVLGSNGVAYGAGLNVDGQLTGVEDDDKTTLTPLSGLPSGVRATGVAAGGVHSLVIGSNGAVYGAGGNRYGQLTGPQLDDTRTLSPLSGLPTGVKATAAAGGYGHSVIVGTDGVVYGAGENSSGQITGAEDPKRTLSPFAGQIVAAGVAPTVVGRAVVGQSLRAAGGAWAPLPTKLTYQWQRNGQAIRGATAPTYRLQPADWKKRVSVQVIGTRAGSAPGSSRASTGVVINKAPKYTAKKKPSIKGTSTVGKTLRIKNLRASGWKPATSKHAFQWYRNGKAIKGATKRAYTVKRADRGKRIRVRITAKKPYYVDGRYTTKPTKKIKKK